MRGATRGAYGAGYIQGISIHAPRAGRDRRWRPGRHRTARYFNPRAPCGARLVESVAAGVDKAISIHAPRAGRDGQRVRALLRVNAISIHAPRAGRDQAAAPVDVAGLISIHAPRAGRDSKGVAHGCYDKRRFQSTRPVRGATSRGGPPAAAPSGNFNPRAPCGARPVASLTSTVQGIFQSTRPVRGATAGLRREILRSTFQSTRPVRGATMRPLKSRTSAMAISIHAPRAGRDDHAWSSSQRIAEFQSTRPVRGATAHIVGAVPSLFISIHAPRAGRDCGVPCTLPPGVYFNPRAPCGARLRLKIIKMQTKQFQSTRPVRGATPESVPKGKAEYRFQSTRPVRGATACSWQCIRQSDISIHAPRAGRDRL